MNIQKNNHAAHTKIEIENVLPTEIEKRSFEIITEELEQEGIVLPERFRHQLQSAAYTPAQISIMQRIWSTPSMRWRKHSKRSEAVLPL